MKNGLRMITLAVAVAALTACSSAERKVNKAEAKKTQEETKTMQDYKSCIKKAKKDEDKLDVCERIMKANQ